MDIAMKKQRASDNPFGIQSRQVPETRRGLMFLRPGGCAQRRPAPAFTLIELLVVIAIIAVLAALIVGIAPKAFDARTRNRIETEMEGLTTVIEAYQDKLGFYPPGNAKPDNSVPPPDARPPLYYELTGTTSEDKGGTFTAIDNTILATAELQSTFGLPGFLNTADSRSDVKNFHASLSPGLVKNEEGQKFKYIVASAKGPDGAFNPWHYQAPGTHNPESFDLWAVVVLRGENVTIGNWKRE